MCGIGGILRREPPSSPDLIDDLLLRSLLHRGPDDRGRYDSPDGLATLVHTRLSILDLRREGRQPMHRHGCWLTFNGEIYNFRSLREELIREGERFTTATDTEVILALYLRRGSDFWRHLRGMYALALWDESRRSGLLLRDPFGIKPLYYGLSKKGDLLFASEVRALLATGEFERKIDPVGLESYLAFGSVAEPHTLVSGISLLKAGHFLRWAGGIVRSQELYFSPKAPTLSPTQDAVIEVRAALSDSVRHHLVSDVSCGILLSGGLDSGAILALTQQTNGSPAATFTLALEDQSCDESEAARKRAAESGSRHHEFLLTGELAENWADEFLSAMDQPSVDGFNTFCIAKFAAAHGYRVLLSGLGADEIFGGYPSQKLIPKMVRLGKILRHFRSCFSTGPNGGSAGSGKTLRLREFLAGSSTVERAYIAVRSIFSVRERRLIMSRILGGPISADDRVELNLSPSGTSGSMAEEICYLEATRYLRNQLLRDADVMGMAHGVEIRVPFVDRRLLETLHRIPPQVRLAPEKKLLRAAVPECDSSPGKAKKRGFTLPYTEWLDGGWGTLPNSRMTDPSIRLDTWSRKWSLYVLSRWLQQNLGWSAP